MRRSVTDVLRRGFDNMVANWPLLVIRVAEGMLFIGIIIAALIALVVPLLVSVGLSHFDPGHIDPDKIGETVLSLFVDHWIWLVWMVVGVTAVLTLFIAIHSAVEAGSAQVYLDAESAAAISRTTTRERFSVFSMQRWLDGMKRGWWATFWIYNIAWSAAGLIILAPLLLASLLIVLTGAGAPAVVVGCLALFVTLMLAFVVSIATNVWVQKAIVIAVARALGAMEALRASWRDIGGDWGRHFGIALLLILLSLAGAAMIGSMSATLSLGGRSLSWQLLTSPIRIVVSIVNTVYSAAMAGWFLACITALTVESR